jgi:hypothetical protein
MLVSDAFEGMVTYFTEYTGIFYGSFSKMNLHETLRGSDLDVECGIFNIGHNSKYPANFSVFGLFLPDQGSGDHHIGYKF